MSSAATCTELRKSESTLDGWEHFASGSGFLSAFIEMACHNGARHIDSSAQAISEQTSIATKLPVTMVVYEYSRYLPSVDRRVKDDALRADLWMVSWHRCSSSNQTRAAGPFRFHLLTTNDRALIFPSKLITNFRNPLNCTPESVKTLISCP